MVPNTPRRIAPILALTFAAAAFAETPPKDTLKPLNDVHFSATTLSDALDFLRDTSGANIEVDWKALGLVGISKDTPVSLRLKNVPLRVALKKTLESAAPGLADFYVQQNVITVTTHDAADEQMVTRTIPVNDLLLDIPDFTGPKLDLTQSNNNTNSGGGSRGQSSGSSSSSSSQSLFTQDNQSTVKQTTREEKATQIIDIIQSTIRPSVWDVNGGKAHIKYFNGSLIITAPVSVQDQIS